MSNNFSSLVRLGGDPLLKYTPSGKPVLSFNAVSTIGYSEKQSVLWIRVSVWNNPEKMKDYLKKGDQIMISGVLSQTEYTANDGSKKTALELNATFIDFVGKKQDTPAASYPVQDSHSAAKANAYQPQQHNPDNFEDAEFRDIPF
jgi:single-strand DNA-binding protein